MTSAEQVAGPESPIWWEWSGELNDGDLVSSVVELSREARHLVALSPLGWLAEISSVVASVPRTFSLADAGQAG